MGCGESKPKRTASLRQLRPEGIIYLTIKDIKCRGNVSVYSHHIIYFNFAWRLRVLWRKPVVSSIDRILKAAQKEFPFNEILSHLCRSIFDLLFDS